MTKQIEYRCDWRTDDRPRERCTSTMHKDPFEGSNEWIVAELPNDHAHINVDTFHLCPEHAKRIRERLGWML